jgi:hypothetical protein
VQRGFLSENLSNLHILTQSTSAVKKLEIRRSGQVADSVGTLFAVNELRSSAIPYRRSRRKDLCPALYR